MNTNKIRIAAVATITAAFLPVTMTAAPAFAAHPHDNDARSPGQTTDSPYAQPLAALGGNTLAQYLQEHQAGDPRTATGF